ncbi:hypothetical protein [Sphingobacterium sp. SGR-19]|uniref:hypothetical protein n=1 Tax=Sphingobacterium sp. SGR-19 TaxID=2710886 RepID=UPI0013EDE375|nr:hypothetical protein [Sphingobacterium sp. SGR-19]NGM65144.1 hypothetical protein [Sphingobacterium sp. SGR-19]
MNSSAYIFTYSAASLHSTEKKPLHTPRKVLPLETLLYHHQPILIYRPYGVLPTRQNYSRPEREIISLGEEYHSTRRSGLSIVVDFRLRLLTTPFNS